MLQLKVTVNKQLKVAEEKEDWEIRKAEEKEDWEIRKVKSISEQWLLCRIFELSCHNTNHHHLF